jgi:outer membrane receptor protein involved in Fe transport
VLETVPGLILTQHTGAGKANQFFLRGFNLDHGTDFATSLDGVPVNLPTHGHGQGYTDLNFLIPELVERVDYEKGVYSARRGDFSSAGAADLRYFRSLEDTIARVEGGRFDYFRSLFASSQELGEGDLVYAAEIFGDDGPWEHSDDFDKANAVLRYAHGDAERGFTVTALGYAGQWDATDQIAERALDLPGFDRFDSLNTTDGGRSQKAMLYGEWHADDEASASRALVYGFYQYLDLFSDFTYELGSPLGDQFEQTDERWVGGADLAHTRFGHLAGRAMENAAGLQLRSDSIENGLFQTVERRRTAKPDYSGGVIPAVTREDEVWELAASPWLENRIQWTDWFRSVAGVRGDYYRFDVDSNLSANSGTEHDFLASPKLSLVFGPWAESEVYLQGGMGFHSNDGRGTTTHVDPSTGDPVDPVDPLVRTYGAEVGVRTTRIRDLQSTFSFWYLDIDSELLFVGDAGTTEASRPSRRYGVELANYWTPTDWLTLDLDVSLSHARFRDDPRDPITGQKIGDQIPGSIESVVAAGATLHDWNGLVTGLRLRYFGERPLIEDDSVRSDDTLLLSALVGYRLNETWTLEGEVYNLLDRDDSEIDYFYESRLPGESAGVEDVHFHPVYPRSFRLALMARF